MPKFDFPNDFNMGKPVIDPSVFIADGVRILGNVEIKKQASIWYNAVLRGDINSISIGIGSNIQDGAIVHLENELGCIVGDYVTVGHGAILHGCKIEDAVLIGMGAIILNGAVIGSGSIIGAGAVVKEGAIIPRQSLVVGVPGKIVKSLPIDTIADNVAWAKKYIQLATVHQNVTSESKK